MYQKMRNVMRATWKGKRGDEAPSIGVLVTSSKNEIAILLNHFAWFIHALWCFPRAACGLTVFHQPTTINYWATPWPSNMQAKVLTLWPKHTMHTARRCSACDVTAYGSVMSLEWPLYRKYADIGIHVCTEACTNTYLSTPTRTSMHT